jgi:hypothetical protein
MEIFDLMWGAVLERLFEHWTARALDEAASLRPPPRSSLVEALANNRPNMVVPIEVFPPRWSWHKSGAR